MRWDGVYWRDRCALSTHLLSLKTDELNSLCIRRLLQLYQRMVLPMYSWYQYTFVVVSCYFYVETTDLDYLDGSYFHSNCYTFHWICSYLRSRIRSRREKVYCCRVRTSIGTEGNRPHQVPTDLIHTGLALEGSRQRTWRKPLLISLALARLSFEPCKPPCAPLDTH